MPTPEVVRAPRESGVAPELCRNSSHAAMSASGQMRRFIEVSDESAVLSTTDIATAARWLSVNLYYRPSERTPAMVPSTSVFSVERRNARRPPHLRPSSSATKRSPVPDGQISLFCGFCLSSPVYKNISLSASGKSNLQLAPSCPIEGRCATSRNAGRDAVDADALSDEGRGGGRRSRVVLTPRRWCQVCGCKSAGDGGKKARSPGRVRRKPLKPLRGECRVIPV